MLETLHASNYVKKNHVNNRLRVDIYSYSFLFSLLYLFFFKKFNFWSIFRNYCN